MMNKSPSIRPNRIRETLDRLYDQQPPVFREQLRRLQEDPSSRVFAPLAESYRRLGRVEEAIEICQRGLSHHPDFHGGRVALAKCYIDKQRYQDAQRELERVVHLAPENLLAQRLLGEVFLAQGLNQPALHAFKMALLLAPSDVGLTDKIHQLETAGATAASSAPRPEEVEVIEKNEFVESLPTHFPLTSSPEPMPLTDPIVSSGNLELVSSQWEAENLEATVFSKMPEVNVEESNPPDGNDEMAAQVNAVLGFEEDSEDVFSVASISSAFKDTQEQNPLEITTETLGDLYFSQGQYGHSLKIFEKIYRMKSSPELERKIKACRVRLGVDSGSQLREKKIKRLKDVLKTLREQQSHPSERE